MPTSRLSDTSRGEHYRLHKTAPYRHLGQGCPLPWEDVDERHADDSFLLVVLGSVAPRDTSLSSEGPTARLLRRGRCPDSSEQ